MSRLLCYVSLWMISLFAAHAQQQALRERETLAFDLPLRMETARATASMEEWPTEVWQRQVAELLTELLKGSDNLPDWVHEAIRFEGFPQSLDLRYQLGSVSVYRPQVDVASSRYKGRKALAEQLAHLRSPFENQAPRIHVKVIDIEPEASGESFSARVLLEIDATKAPWIQQRAEWQTMWTTSMRLREIDSRFFEATHLNSERRMLSDRTASVFAKEPAFGKHLSLGIDDWRGRLESGLAPLITGFFGLAIGDANGDGWEDLFLCQPHGLPNRLFLRQPDGTLADAPQSEGLDLLDATSSALFIDADNDGDQDLLVAGDGFFIYYANDGNAHFQTRQALPLPGTVSSLAAADYDRDGRVDLYVCGHTTLSQKDQDTPLGLPVPIHDANNGQANVIFHNTIDRGFVDVTASVGLDANNHRFSYAASWEDYDHDGDADLYVANDFGKNNLYRNDQGHFTDVAKLLGVEDTGSGMSVSWGDVNGDGWMDLYVGNMYSSAGNRIANDQEGIQELAQGNSLFINRNGRRFEKVSADQRVHLGRWSWSSMIADLNNDGWQDLLVANGFVTNRRLDDL